MEKNEIFSRAAWINLGRRKNCHRCFDGKGKDSFKGYSGLHDKIDSIAKI